MKIGFSDDFYVFDDIDSKKNPNLTSSNQLIEVSDLKEFKLLFEKDFLLSTALESIEMNSESPYVSPGNSNYDVSLNVKILHPKSIDDTKSASSITFEISVNDFNNKSSQQMSVKDDDQEVFRDSIDKSLKYLFPDTNKKLTSEQREDLLADLQYRLMVSIMDKFVLPNLRLKQEISRKNLSAISKPQLEANREWN